MTSVYDRYLRRRYTAPYLSVTLPLAHVAANLYSNPQKVEFGKFGMSYAGPLELWMLEEFC
jgi:hypothetical protein